MIVDTKRASLAAVFIMGALGISSCVFHRSYPAEWAPLKVSAGSACPIISGVYRDLGTAASWLSVCIQQGTTCWLGQNLLSEKAEGTHVTISQPGDKVLEIRHWMDNSVLGERILYLEKDEFSCSSEGLEIERPDSFVSRVLQKSEDDSLVMRRRESRLAFMLLPLPPFITAFPWYANSWVRWESVPMNRPVSQE